VGVIVSTVPTSMYCTVCTRPVGSLGTVCETCTNGRDEPTLSVACRLFCAMITGSDRTRTSPRSCSAAIATSYLIVPFPPVSCTMKSRALAWGGAVTVTSAAVFPGGTCLAVPDTPRSRSCVRWTSAIVTSIST
jgi:hypothetical protein